MSTAKILSAIPIGYEAQAITVEGDQNQGLPCLNIIGLPGRSIEESKDRIRSAINNSKFAFPHHKLIINLAPAELQKTGSTLDLPIALCILTLSQQLLPADTSGRIFIGELALNGEIRPVKGIISIIECAKSITGIKEIYIPAANANQASLVVDEKLRICPVKNLRQVWLAIKEIRPVEPLKLVVKNTNTDKHEHFLSEIVGQEQAKRALIIALAGRHNLLLFGPPGSGKSMLANCAKSLLPNPSLEERIAITKLHSLSSSDYLNICGRPFRAPHHSITKSAFLGGGNPITPGEVALAHQGILFLDELPEFPRELLESLRQPLEDRKIRITRACGEVNFPADFMLIATMNPCPCGYLGSKQKECKCTPTQIQNYRKKLSGPLLDRIDMCVELPNQDNSVLLNFTTTSTTQDASAKQQIERALNTQFERYKNHNTTNANIPSPQLKTQLKLTSDAKELLDLASNKLKLSARAYLRCIRVARTIADLEAKPSKKIQAKHISEALQYRQIIPD